MRLLKLVPDNTNIGFVRLRHWAFGLTALLTLLAVGAVAWRGLNLGVDFVGGISVEESFGRRPDLDRLRATIERVGVGDPVIQQAGSDTRYTIRLPAPSGGDNREIDSIVRRADQGIRAAFPDAKFQSRDVISGKVSGELIRNGILAVVLAVAAIAVFGWLRFEWQFGVSTFVAIAHDVLMTLGFFAVTQLEFDLNIVAAVLTIVGYSINDKIVIDDRIRENMRKYRQMDMRALIDLSVNETLPRTVMTSLTIIIALAALLIFGGHVLRGFTAAMLLGIVVGTYSSIYVSSSLLISLGLKPQTFNKTPATKTPNAERIGPRDGAKP